jgi:hypothetical protein
MNTTLGQAEQDSKGVRCVLCGEPVDTGTKHPECAEAEKNQGRLF